MIEWSLLRVVEESSAKLNGPSVFMKVRSSLVETCD
jgi:hypothetical protein